MIVRHNTASLLFACEVQSNGEETPTVHLAKLNSVQNEHSVICTCAPYEMSSQNQIRRGRLQSNRPRDWAVTIDNGPKKREQPQQPRPPGWPSRREVWEDYPLGPLSLLGPVVMDRL